MCFIRLRMMKVVPVTGSRARNIFEECNAFGVIVKRQGSLLQGSPGSGASIGETWLHSGGRVLKSSNPQVVARISAAAALPGAA